MRPRRAGSRAFAEAGRVVPTPEDVLVFGKNTVWQTICAGQLRTRLQLCEIRSAIWRDDDAHPITLPSQVADDFSRSAKCWSGPHAERIEFPRERAAQCLAAERNAVRIAGRANVILMAEVVIQIFNTTDEIARDRHFGAAAD